MKPKGSPVIREREAKAYNWSSGILGRHSEPGSDEPHKPVAVHARIANRAYELYQWRGRQDGQALRDWLQAEREISGT